MKRIILFALLAVTVLTANAATRKWDFRTWGATTVANLMLGAGQVSPSNNWSDIEKSTATAPSATSANNCFWQVAVQTAGTTLQANGQDIEECVGLLFTNTSARALAIAVNYPTALNDYAGPSYLWLGSKNINYFTIPNVKPGSVIKMGVESHKTTEARGVQLFVGSNSGTQLKDPDGNDVATPSTYEDQQWLVPEEGLTDTPNEDGTYNIVVRNTNGCHLYYITVSEGADTEAAKNVAWVTADMSEMPYLVRPTDNINYTDILASAADVTADSLRAFDAVVVSTNVAADASMAKLLEDNIAYVPMVNLNPNLFGYTAVDTENTTLTAVDKDNALFASTGMDENGSFEYTNLAVNLPAKFASDDILAKNGEAVAIHQHKASRNSYLLLPTNDQVIEKTAWLALLPNAISTVAATKKKVTAVAEPVITASYAEGATTVSISCSTSGAEIKYALGEGDFQTYTEPITLTAEETVWAYATAEGYTPMTEDDAVSLAVKVYTKTAVPTISVSDVDGVATVTMTAAEGAHIFYNFVNSSDSTESALYAEPFTLTENTTVTAFATKTGYLNSDATSQAIEIAGLKLMQKTLGHFDANKSEWANGESKTYYYCYLRGNSEKKYSVNENYTCEYSPEGNDWTLKTSGQQVVWESTTPQKKVGDTTNYNPVRITDLIGNEITGGEVTFGTTATSTVYDVDGVTPIKDAEGNDSTASDKPTAELVSKVKFQGPFNVVTYIGCKPNKQGFAYLISTDAEKWDTLAVSPAGPEYTDAASKWRLWHRDVISYNGTDQVYLKLKSISTDSYRIFDVFVKGEGTDEDTAIQNVNAEAVKPSAVRKYISNGQVIIVTPRGTYSVTGAQLK